MKSYFFLVEEIQRPSSGHFIHDDCVGSKSCKRARTTLLRKRRDYWFYSKLSLLICSPSCCFKIMTIKCKLNSNDVWTPRKCVACFMLSRGELFDWSNLLYLTLLGVVCMNISRFSYINIQGYQKWNIYINVYIYTLSLSDDRFHKDVKPRYFLKNYDNYWWFKRNYCCIRGSFAAISWVQFSIMSSTVILSWHAFSFRLLLSRRGGLQGREGDYTHYTLGLLSRKFSP